MSLRLLKLGTSASRGLDCGMEASTECKASATLPSLTTAGSSVFCRLGCGEDPGDMFDVVSEKLSVEVGVEVSREVVDKESSDISSEGLSRTSACRTKL